MEHHGLDLAHYYTEVSLDALLKLTIGQSSSYYNRHRPAPSHRMNVYVKATAWCHNDSRSEQTGESWL